VDGYYILIANVRAHPMFNLVTERDKMHYIDGGKQQQQQQQENGQKWRGRAWHFVTRHLRVSLGGVEGVDGFFAGQREGGPSKVSGPQSAR
jgi:hypothetical protein